MMIWFLINWKAKKMRKTIECDKMSWIKRHNQPSMPTMKKKFRCQQQIEKKKNDKKMGFNRNIPQMFLPCN